METRSKDARGTSRWRRGAVAFPPTSVLSWAGGLQRGPLGSQPPALQKAQRLHPEGRRRAVDVVHKPSSVPREGLPARGSGHSSRAAVTGRLEQPTRRLGRVALRGVATLAPAYAALLPMGFAVPSTLPPTRWALTPPFHPYLALTLPGRGGFFSVALSWAFPPPGVTRHRTLRSSDFPPVRQKANRRSLVRRQRAQIGTLRGLSQRKRD